MTIQQVEAQESMADLVQRTEFLMILHGQAANIHRP